MKSLKLLIIFSVFLVACGERPLPNQELMSAYEFLIKGEIDTARIIAEKAERLTIADSALYNIVCGAVAAANFEWEFCDSIGIEKSIHFYDGDNEKSAWAHLIKGVILYNYVSYDDAALEFRTAEKLAEPIDCNELKFLINYRLIHCNINSYNFDEYIDLSAKIQKYAVTNFDKAQYYFFKAAVAYEMGWGIIDSAKYYAQKGIQCIEKEYKKHRMSVFFFHSYAEIICDQDDSTAEKYIQKSFEIDTLGQAFTVLGRIYLHRGDEQQAQQYFAVARGNRYWGENEEKINHYLHDFYAGKNDYKTAYHYALQRIQAKDSIINKIQTNDIKPVQAKFEAEIENLKLKSSFEKKIFLTILISAVILAVLVLVVVFQKYKLADRSRKISETQRTINDYNQKINELQRTNTEHSDEEIKYLQQKVKALEMKFSDIYVRGKELYRQILNDKKIGRWSKEDYKNFIDYYQSLDFLYVYSFETDYTSLTDRQKIFLILLHIGKTKEQVMQIMTIEESSFRSMKSRAEGQRK